MVVLVMPCRRCWLGRLCLLLLTIDCIGTLQWISQFHWSIHLWFNARGGPEAAFNTRHLQTMCSCLCVKRAASQEEVILQVSADCLGYTVTACNVDMSSRSLLTCIPLSQDFEAKVLQSRVNDLEVQSCSPPRIL